MNEHEIFLEVYRILKLFIDNQGVAAEASISIASTLWEQMNKPEEE